MYKYVLEGTNRQVQTEPRSAHRPARDAMHEPTLPTGLPQETKLAPPPVLLHRLASRLQEVGG